MKETIVVERKAHFYIQKPEKEIKSLLIVIHGYAQRAEDFITTFSELKTTNILVIAPEGLSKFYNNKRETVASWMTSHERLDEITDYCAYLDKVFEKLNQDYNFKKIAILGFSQGVSTLMRWLGTQKLNEAQLYLCAGSIPPELKAEDFENKKDLKINYYYGDKDKLHSIENAKKQLAALESLKVDYKAYEYEGRHEVPNCCIDHIKTDLSLD